jgi:hypothetical protein
VSTGPSRTYSAGDQFRVEVVEGVVQYVHNEEVFYRSTRVPTYPLVADTSLMDPGATLVGVTLTQP